MKNKISGRVSAECVVDLKFMRETCTLYANYKVNIYMPFFCSPVTSWMEENASASIFLLISLIALNRFNANEAEREQETRHAHKCFWVCHSSLPLHVDLCAVFFCHAIIKRRCTKGECIWWISFSLVLNNKAIIHWYFSSSLCCRRTIQLLLKIFLKTVVVSITVYSIYKFNMVKKRLKKNDGKSPDLRNGNLNLDFFCLPRLWIEIVGFLWRCAYRVNRAILIHPWLLVAPNGARHLQYVMPLW